MLLFDSIFYFHGKFWINSINGYHIFLNIHTRFTLLYPYEHNYSILLLFDVSKIAG